MYQIENKSNIFVEFFNYRYVDLIGNEQDLIKYLAKGFHDNYSESFLYEEEEDLLEYDYSNSLLSEHFFDGYGRDINAHAYKKDAWTYYCLYIRNKDRTDKKDYSYWHKNKKSYKGIFRKTPVEGIRKWRGGPSVRSRRIKHIKAMYANPEYKEFNRGSHKDIPKGWFDDWSRCRERETGNLKVSGVINGKEMLVCNTLE